MNGGDLDSARLKMRADRAAGTEKRTVQVSMCAGTCRLQSRFSHVSIIGINSAPKSSGFAAVRKVSHRREEIGSIIVGTHYRPTPMYGPTGHAIGGTAQLVLRSSSAAAIIAGRVTLSEDYGPGVAAGGWTSPPPPPAIA